ncbi:voltage-dependent anion channel [Pyrenochaeta sp. MPI-SDFR-AT-0127]|nr:voltage-dependent anion channel [Pyrenochaeta sp. MPI-SDFR-AT-0127]
MATNGHTTANSGAGMQPQRKSALSIAIDNFTPLWFTICMDTGVLSIIMNLLPYQFRGLGVLSTIMFIFNIVLFVFFTLVSIAKHVSQRSKGRSAHHSYVKNRILSNLEELSYLGAPAIAYLTLVAQVTLTCSTAWGYSWTIVAYVLWWIGLVWTVTLCSASVILLSKYQITSDREISPVIFLPLIGVMTLGTTGGLVTNYSVDMSATLAIPVIIVGYLAIGYALFLSLLYYSYLAHRLLAVGIPEPTKVPTLVVAVGPMGQFATAIQVLSTAASKRGLFGEYQEGTWLQASAASSVSAASVLIALLALGFAFLWITVAWYIVIETLFKRLLPFNLTWWSLIFPMGVFTTALLNLSNGLNSPAFRGLTTALLIFLLAIYFINWAGTFYRLYTGQALGVPQHRLEEDEQAKQKKERLSDHVARDTPGNGNENGRNV